MFVRVLATIIWVSLASTVLLNGLGHVHPQKCIHFERVGMSMSDLTQSTYLARKS